ncbi:hypothetical protein, partial [Nocardia cyriacigeorgica]|uniref:hypothetical protein n=1 Tax=Nocardia cyriacigeorgica TaxID=135487 RepID=UPI001C498DDC
VSARGWTGVLIVYLLGSRDAMEACGAGVERTVDHCAANIDITYVVRAYKAADATAIAGNRRNTLLSRGPARSTGQRSARLPW